jgi:predicted amidophosphoribosyltransferase
VDRARAVGGYDGALRAIVHALKYEGRRSLAQPLAELMRVRGADMLNGADWVVPVPVHASRRRERGFNQAADLARHLGVPVCLALCRHRATRKQTELPAARRHANLRGAFAVALGSACAMRRRRPLKPSATHQRQFAQQAGSVRALTAPRVVTPPR